MTHGRELFTLWHVIITLLVLVLLTSRHHAASINSLLPLVQCLPDLLGVLELRFSHVSQLCQTVQHLHHHHVLPEHIKKIQNPTTTQVMPSCSPVDETFLKHLTHRHSFAAILPWHTIHPRNTLLSFPAYHTSGPRRPTTTL